MQCLLSQQRKEHWGDLYLHLNNEYLPQVVTPSTLLVAARRATEEFIANPDQVILNLKVSLHQDMGDIGIKVLERLMSIEKEFLGLPDKYKGTWKIDEHRKRIPWLAGQRSWSTDSFVETYHNEHQQRRGYGRCQQDTGESCIQHQDVWWESTIWKTNQYCDKPSWYFKWKTLRMVYQVSKDNIPKWLCTGWC